MRKKDRRFELEGEIVTLIFDDNRSTVHFDYHVDIDDVDNSVQLDLYTRNAKNNAIFLLHQTRGTSSVRALENMLDHLRQSHMDEEKNSYTVKWVDRNDPDKEEHVSYFYEFDEKGVRQKFFYNRAENDFLISIEMNPIS